MGNRIEKILFWLLRNAVGDESEDEISKEQITPEVLSCVYEIAKAHDTAHLLYNPLKSLGLLEINPDITAKCRKKRLAAVYRTEQQVYECDEICRVLEEAEILHVPLKGSVIRKMYPEPYMRTSCDIDVLVKKDDLERTVKMLSEKLNYKYEVTHGHDAQLFSPSGVHIEIHYDLLEKKQVGGLKTILDEAWKHTESVPDFKSRRAFTAEFFYFYHIVHMAKHFHNGGCGIRPFADIYYIERKLGFDRAKFEELCKKYKMLDFYHASVALTNEWFGGLPHGELTGIMAEYVLFGGAYGHTYSKTLVHQITHGGKLGFILNKAWMPYHDLVRQYPSLEGKKPLILFYQMRRWGRLVFCGRAKEDIKNLGLDRDYSDKHDKTKYMVKKLGL